MCKKRFLSAALVCCLLISLFPFQVIAVESDVLTGSCGENLVYTLDCTTSTLTISGTGPMRDYAVSPSYAYDRTTPWFSHRGNVRKVIVNPGVTSIGDFAFALCSVESISLPNTITVLGHYAFEKCSLLQDITIPNSIQTIGEFAFEGCTGLTQITIPAGVVNIEGGRFPIVLN